MHGIQAKAPEVHTVPNKHLRKPSNGVPLSKLQKTDAIFDAFVDQHLDFVKDPNEVKML